MSTQEEKIQAQGDQPLRGLLAGIPPKTPLAVIQIQFPATNRWAILILPTDMTSAELQTLVSELTSLVDESLRPIARKAAVIERDDPTTAARAPWEDRR
jgi:hypothetical protein